MKCVTSATPGGQNDSVCCSIMLILKYICIVCHSSLFEQLPAVEHMCELNTAATESAEVEH